MKQFTKLIYRNPTSLQRLLYGLISNHTYMQPGPYSTASLTWDAFDYFKNTNTKCTNKQVQDKLNHLPAGFFLASFRFICFCLLPVNWLGITNGSVNSKHGHPRSPPQAFVRHLLFSLWRNYKFHTVGSVKMYDNIVWLRKVCKWPTYDHDCVSHFILSYM